MARQSLASRLTLALLVSVGLAEGAAHPNFIVILTDGANTQGVDPQTAAKQAAARHIRTYTIGFGTTTPTGTCW